MRRPVYLFTDFSTQGPYVGQMHARIVAEDVALRVIDLMHDAPPMRPDLAAYLLPASCAALPEGSVVLGVVDPGVGSARRPLVVETARTTFIGPDNGLFSQLPDIRGVAEITWRPDELAPSFHGRDLFAPVAARLASGRPVACTELPLQAWVGGDWPVGLPAVVYIDGYGNVMIGINRKNTPEINSVAVGKQPLPRAETFSDVPPGVAFWYWNSLGLLEIAVNGGSAAKRFSLALGDKVLVD